ncbi:cysteine protease StiP family protein [Pullulanibacillus sp. KACC 23026]|uniref:cysteine protease StiP family protein n=1 Tax=Pullulanibacillus sp. KACC 23026 TaxID=3028315 RepID=UPI0023B194E1|nr:cysteine protease StiP family protein [Pullulanibacillus sp. KACC 23026]WEG14622.1 cysteine protease StiP family protein [Pullulanibacillus sp. KACC 23026]
MISRSVKPDKMGSYKEEDVVFLLQDIGKYVLERNTEEREQLIQAGTHYSEMLPVEYQPNEEYVALFHDTLHLYSKRLAVAVGLVAEQIKEKKSLEHLVIVSLARAGTPIGVLIKRYLSFKYSVDVPHYSISIIRGRGIDEVAIDYIYRHHPQAAIQFVDGWTGKGAITSELDEACQSYNSTHINQLDSTLAVLADPGHCVEIFGTRDDFLIPSACLNSTVSGLVSRTVLNRRFMKPGELHGAKYYKELAEADVSNLYVDTIEQEFPHIQEDIDQGLSELKNSDPTPTWKGLASVEWIQETFKISNRHFVKPGVGETTRVLLRRMPWKILINPHFTNDLTHILMLAKERHVPVEAFTEMTYSCCGLIKEL